MKRYITFGFLILLVAGCVSTTYLNNSPPYSQYVGKKYVLTRDCYIYKGDTRSVNIGARVDAPGEGNSNLPKDVAASYVGKWYYGAFIRGIAKKGTVFRVANIRRDDYFEVRLICYEIELEGFSVVDAFDILDHSMRGPSTISPLFAREVVETNVATRSSNELLGK